MATVAELRSQIVAGIGAAAATLDLAPCAGASFAARTGPATRMVTVSFLDRRHAATLATSTATFALELGVHYHQRADPDGAPEDHVRCHLRHVLHRDFAQAPPAADLAPADRRRRDLWWVAADSDSAIALTERAAELVRGRGRRWLARFSNPVAAERSLRWWWLTRLLPSAPITVGRPGSPAHRELLDLLARVRRA